MCFGLLCDAYRSGDVALHSIVMSGEPEHSSSGVLIPLECQVCGNTFLARIGDEIAAKLQAAGVTGDEIGQAINRGQLDWRITCHVCADGQQT